MISAVIPAYNAAAFIRRTIDSILAQSLQPEEIIVVDDGSTDDTKSVVDAYGGKVRCIRQENAGDGPARNTGVAAAKGEWIAFLDHDDEWLPHKLELQMALLDRHGDLRWCGTNYNKSCFGWVAPVGDRRALEHRLAGREYFENYLDATAAGCGLITATMVIRKEVLQEVGGFDSCWLRWADLDMWWRIAYRYPRIGYIPEPLATVHLDVQGTRSTQLRLASKRGRQVWDLMDRHVALSKNSGAFEHFRPIARQFLRESLMTMLYHGFAADARQTIRRFREFFAWHWRVGTYMLTVCPGLSSRLLRAAAYVGHRLKLEKEVSRRWVARGDTPVGKSDDVSSGGHR